jgi:tripartite-type tricarboxylate transporter receptor subunit TctC
MTIAPVTIARATIARRRLLKLAASAVAMPAVSRLARADTYPARPVHLIVPQAAGSSTDIHARLIAQWLSEHLGQPFVVDVKPGAGGNVGTEAVVHSSADGYTLLTVNSQNAISPALYPELTFNFIRDIAPIGQISIAPLIMEVNPSVPAKTVPEFIAYAKANPGKISMASAGVGGPQHLAGELFKSMTGLNLVHVPYRGSTPAVADMLSGQVQLMFDVTPTALPQIKADTLRPLAVTTKARLDALPDVPSLSDFLPGYEAEGWLGMGAPAGTPPDIVAALNKQINAALADATIKQRLTDIGVVVRGGSTADFGKFIASETDKWGKVIRDAGIKPD